MFFTAADRPDSRLPDPDRREGSKTSRQTGTAEKPFSSRPARHGDSMAPAAQESQPRSAAGRVKRTHAASRRSRVQRPCPQSLLWGREFSPHCIVLTLTQVKRDRQGGQPENTRSHAACSHRRHSRFGEIGRKRLRLPRGELCLNAYYNSGGND